MKSDNKLTQQDLNNISLRYMTGAQLGWNYERMMSVAYTRAMYPALAKLYGHDQDKFKDILKTELQFFNTSPFLTAFIMGLDLALQNENGYQSKEAVAAIKTSLMGPFAAVGDALFGAVIPTIMGSLAAYMALEGNPAGVLLWLLVSLVIWGLRYFELPFAFKQGTKLITKIGNILQDLTESATLLGILVVGGLIPTVVKVTVPFKFVIGKKEIALQADMLDKILPAAVPIILVGLAYWLLGRKNMNSTRVIWIFMILSIICYALKVLAIGQ